MKSKFVCLLFSCFVVYALEWSPLLAAAAEETLVIAAFDYKPFVGQDLPAQGYIAEIATEALRRAGYAVEYQFCPLKRALYLAQEGEVDGVLGAYYAAERTGYLEYSEPMGGIRVNFLARKDRNIAYQQPSDLAPYAIGVLLGTSLVESLHNDHLTTDEVESNVKNLNKLLAGRVDLVVGTTEWLLYDLNANFSAAEQAQLVVLDPPYQVQQIYFTTAKKRSASKEVIERFNNGLQQMKADGTYAAILQQHRIGQ